MVYCGKPSKACSECRIKRRKCDLSRPSCRSCIRARSICSYRDQVALAFRDQSTHVVSKVRGTTVHAKDKGHTVGESKNPSSHRATLPQGTPQHVGLRHPCSPYTAAIVSSEHDPVGFFFHHYFLDEQSTGGEYINCVPIMYGNAAVNTSMPVLINAIGLASLSTVRKAPSLMNAASRQYSLALQGLWPGLTDPIVAKSDQMMVSVMLLALYEMVVCQVAEDTTSPQSHTDGALALLHLRGIGQLNNESGRKLFIQIRLDVLTSCLQRVEPVPQDLLKWMARARNFETDHEKAASRLADIVVKICAIRAATKSLNHADHTDMADLSHFISETFSINANLLEWSRSRSCTYDYTTTSMERKTFLGEKYHSYSNLWDAYTWNFYRCAQILLNRTITMLVRLRLQHIPSDPMSLDSCCIATSRAAIQDAINGICASVPVILGYFGGEKHNMKARCGRALLWPIYIVGSAEDTSDSLRQWAIAQLEEIGDGTGIQKAHILAKFLRNHEPYFR